MNVCPEWLFGVLRGAEIEHEMTHDRRRKRENWEEIRWNDEEKGIGRGGQREKQKCTRQVEEERLGISNDKGGETK